ncbi:signal peptidase 22kDa subunit [Zychaea mexicana]|uniref:signal peptidase 22kDa subunit n=1 Tax=Zychaea mexicana TaxID=64656 RepID=UPI0022FE9229|nr:signal peptidase 22kDa subunit [Zychaea mexicana]KAI9496198.1 signal peptidase 22kDa subunit [Zychaea mexicana]
MYNLQQRANVLFSFAITALGGILAVVAGISYITGYASISSDIRVDADTLRVVSRRYGPDYYDYGTPKSHFARFAFDLDADFTPAFNWNTKQVFVTVVAEYETKTHDRNSVVLWDKIITRKEDASLSLRNIANKYALVDVSRKWSHQQANLSLHWDITPYVGVIQGGRTPSNPTTIILSPAPSS